MKLVPWSIFVRGMGGCVSSSPAPSPSVRSHITPSTSEPLPLPSPPPSPGVALILSRLREHTLVDPSPSTSLSAASPAEEQLTLEAIALEARDPSADVPAYRIGTEDTYFTVRSGQVGVSIGGVDGSPALLTPTGQALSNIAAHIRGDDTGPALAALVKVFFLCTRPWTAEREVALKIFYSAGILPGCALWLGRLRPKEGSSPSMRPGQGPPLTWRLNPIGFILWSVPESRSEVGAALEAAGISLPEIIALAVGAPDNELASFAFYAAGAFSYSPAHRAVLFASEPFLRQVAQLAFEAAVAPGVLDPGFESGHSACMCFVAYALRAASLTEAAQLYASLSRHLADVAATAAAAASYSLADLLVRSSARTEWAVPHRSLVYMAISQLIKADWPSIGLSQPGPVLAALSAAPARAPLLACCNLAVWSVRDCIPSIFVAVLASAPLKVQLDVAQASLCRLSLSVCVTRPRPQRAWLSPRLASS